MINFKVTLIVPCYNQAQYLSETLLSIVNQTYENWECIIINDGSIDDTHQLAQNWLEKDKRFKYLQKENGGLSSARNAGLELAEGDYIQFLDSDDIIDSKKFEFSIAEIKKSQSKNKTIVISYFNFFTNNISNATNEYCTLTPELLNFKSVLYNWDYEFSIPIHCGFFSADLFSDFRFSTELKAKEDWLMWLHFFKKDITIHFIDLPLAFYRSHPESMTKDRKFMEQNTIKVLQLFKNILPEDEYHNYLIFVIQKKNAELETLRNKLPKDRITFWSKVDNKRKKKTLIRSLLKYCFSIFTLKKK